MKKILFVLTLLFGIGLVSCRGNSKANTETTDCDFVDTLTVEIGDSIL